MTSEGKSAREVAEGIVADYGRANHATPESTKMWDRHAEKITEIIERESRLSIAAALEMAEATIEENIIPVEPRIVGLTVMQAWPSLRVGLIGNIRKITTEQVAHVRAERDKEIVAQARAEDEAKRAIEIERIAREVTEEAKIEVEREIAAQAEHDREIREDEAKWWMHARPPLAHMNSSISGYPDSRTDCRCIGCNRIRAIRESVERQAASPEGEK